MIRIFKHYVPVSLLLLGFFEFLVVGLVFYFVSGSSFLHEVNPLIEESLSVGQAALFGYIYFLSLIAMGLYHRRLSDDFRDWFFRIFLGFFCGSLVVLPLIYLAPDPAPCWKSTSVAIGLALVLVALLRKVFFMVTDRKYLNRRVLILGTGKAAVEIEKLRRRSDQHGCTIVGYVNALNEELCVDADKVIEKDVTLAELVERHLVEEIIIAVKDRRKTLPVDELLACKMLGTSVIDLPTFFERQLGMIRLDVINPSWMIFSDGFKAGVVRSAMKRCFDLSASFGMLVIVWPIMLLAAAAIMMESKGRGTVFYSQVRVGEMGRPFEVIKFRSMRMDAEKNGAQWATQDDDRVTAVGKFIRKTRIDELPQLINVLRGDMSFVGPRPERPEFVEQLSEKIPYFNDRHMVKPGITGWAQISYPYGASEEDSRQKLQYDLYYAKNYSIFLDFAIMLQTAEVILWGKGAR